MLIEFLSSFFVGPSPWLKDPQNFEYLGVLVHPKRGCILYQTLGRKQHASTQLVPKNLFIALKKEFVHFL